MTNAVVYTALFLLQNETKTKIETETEAKPLNVTGTTEGMNRRRPMELNVDFSNTTPKMIHFNTNFEMKSETTPSMLINFNSVEMMNETTIEFEQLDACKKIFEMLHSMSCFPRPPLPPPPPPPFTFNCT